ncbi:MAG: hypothetical protein R3C32_06510 [Chloroflexota bacterium]
MRDVLDRLERLGLRWYITGSEAASCYGVLRRTFDTDIVLDLEPAASLASGAPSMTTSTWCPTRCDYGDFSMASVIVSAAMARRTSSCGVSPWTASTLARRQRLDRPSLGITWVSSLEDLMLRQGTVWSGGDLGGSSCRTAALLLRVNDGRVDDAYPRPMKADPLASHPSSRRCGMRPDPGQDIRRP